MTERFVELTDPRDVENADLKRQLEQLREAYADLRWRMEELEAK